MCSLHKMLDLKVNFGDGDSLIQSESGAVMREKIAYAWREYNFLLAMNGLQPAEVRSVARCQDTYKY